MTLSVLTPNATNYSLNATITGAATAHQALADASTSTYVGFTGQTTNLSVGFTDLTLPANAVVKQLAVLMQDARGGTGAMALANHIAAGPHFTSSQQTLSWTSPTTHYGTVMAEAEITDTQVDGVSVVVVSAGSATALAALYTLSLAVTYVTIPVVDVTAPTGTLTDDTTPAVHWSRSFDAAGGSQTHYQVQIKDAGTDEVVSESGILPGEDTSWQSTTRLPDDSYEASVRVAQTVNGVQHWSAWNDQAFVVDVPQPAVPTLTLIPEASNGRIRVELEDPGGGAVSTDFFQVEVSYDGGVTFVAIRAGEEGLITPEVGAATVYNYDAPNGTLVYYRVRSVHEYTSATGVKTYAYSAYTKDTDSWSSDDWWLKHPTRPSVNLSPVIKSQPGRSSQIAQGVFHPLGRRDPVVVSDLRQSFSGEVVLRCESDADRTALDAILADGAPLLLQAPAAAYWDDTWIAISQHERTRPIDSEWGAYTFDSLAWVEVVRPTESLEEGE